MLVFWLLIISLALIAAAVVILPCLKHRGLEADEPTRQAVNIQAYQERLAELDKEQQAGTIDLITYQRLSTELGRNLLAEAKSQPITLNQSDKASKAISRKKAFWLPVTAGLLTPLVAFGLYLHWGNSQGLVEQRAFAQLRQKQQALVTGQLTLQEMLNYLQTATRRHPKQAQNWYYLGLTYGQLGDYPQAAAAYRQALDLLGQSPQIMARYAQARFLANHHQIDADLLALLKQVVELDENNETALSLLGVHAFHHQQFQQAIAYWRRALRALPPGASAQAIESGIAKAQARLQQLEPSVGADGGNQ